MKEYEVYIQDREAAKAAVVGGEKIEVMGTEYVLLLTENDREMLREQVRECCSG
jgi:hypothetical protein